MALHQTRPLRNIMVGVLHLSTVILNLLKEDRVVWWWWCITTKLSSARTALHQHQTVKWSPNIHCSSSDLTSLLLCYRKYFHLFLFLNVSVSSNCDENPILLFRERVKRNWCAGKNKVGSLSRLYLVANAKRCADVTNFRTTFFAVKSFFYRSLNGNYFSTDILHFTCFIYRSGIATQGPMLPGMALLLSPRYPV